MLPFVFIKLRRRSCRVVKPGSALLILDLAVYGHVGDISVSLLSASASGYPPARVLMNPRLYRIFIKIGKLVCWLVFEERWWNAPASQIKGTQASADSGGNAKANLVRPAVHATPLQIKNVKRIADEGGLAGH
jgi:hypothetical protein